MVRALGLMVLIVVAALAAVSAGSKDDVRSKSEAVKDADPAKPSRSDAPGQWTG